MQPLVYFFDHPQISPGCPLFFRLASLEGQPIFLDHLHGISRDEEGVVRPFERVMPHKFLGLFLVLVVKAAMACLSLQRRSLPWLAENEAFLLTKNLVGVLYDHVGELESVLHLLVLELIANFVVQLQELLFIHHIEHLDKNEAVWVRDLVCPEELLAGFASQCLLLFVGKGFAPD